MGARCSEDAVQSMPDAVNDAVQSMWDAISGVKDAVQCRPDEGK